MAIQAYFQKDSDYHNHSLIWLRSPHGAEPTPTNFQFLMQNVGSVVTWKTGAWNTSADYTRVRNRTERLILGPINEFTDPGRNCPLSTISLHEFFYVDDNTRIDEVPTYLPDTPFIIRGIATALRDCLSEVIDGKRPYYKNRFYKVRFCNHLLEIATEPYPPTIAVTSTTTVSGATVTGLPSQ